MSIGIVENNIFTLDLLLPHLFEAIVIDIIKNIEICRCMNILIYFINKNSCVYDK
jgi:hypothetical protein